MEVLMIYNIVSAYCCKNWVNSTWSMGWIS